MEGSSYSLSLVSHVGNCSQGGYQEDDSLTKNGGSMGLIRMIVSNLCAM